MIVQELYDWINETAPYDRQEEWDNSGWMCGSMDQVCTGVVLSLDVTRESIETAVRTGANVILTHHPMIFHKLSCVPSDSMTAECIRRGLTVLSAHTNLDKASGGVNDVLARRLELRDVFVAPDGMCRIGNLPCPMSPETLVRYAAERLQASPVRFTAPAEAELKTIGICGGAGGDFWRDLRNMGCDAVLSGDLRHDVFVDAKNEGFTVLDAGHFSTEWPVMEYLKDQLLSRWPGLPVFLVERRLPYQVI